MQSILVALCFMTLNVIHVLNNIEISFKGTKEPLA